MATVATRSKPEEAHLIRSLLEGNGVAAYVRDEYVVAIDWFYSNAVGGVKVDVADEDVERAQEIIRSVGADSS